MKVRQALLRPFALPLVRPLATAHGSIVARRGWLVRLQDEAGGIGLGEATPLAAFGTESEPACEAALVGILGAWAAEGSERTLGERLAELDAARIATPCAAAAIDTALHDQAARRAGRTLASWLRRRSPANQNAGGHAGRPASRVAVQALIGGDTPEAVVTSARAAGTQGFSAFKLKLGVSSGGGDLARDRARVKALRAVVGSAARLRLDANEAWTPSEAEAALASLAPFDIDYVEQPVARGDCDALAWLAARSPIAVAADEALIGHGLEACLARPEITVFVVKPAALGGIEPSARLIERARAPQRGEPLRLVWSTLLDGAVSRAAVWHLAAGLGPADEVHGLATGDWLARDLAPGAPIRDGQLPAPADGPGLGLEPGSATADAFGWDADDSEPAANSIWTAPARVFGEVR